MSEGAEFAGAPLARASRGLFRSPSPLARSRLRSWWLSGPNNRRKNIAQRILSSGWILKAAGIISTRAHRMAMREQAATPAAAKRNWRACVQWQTDRVGGRPEISRNRMVSFGFERTLVAARCQAIGCFLWLLQRRSAKAFAVISPRLLPRVEGFRGPGQLRRCYLAANNSENSKLHRTPSTRSDAQPLEASK